MKFAQDKHILYFKNHLNYLPHPYVSFDSSRLTAVYFCVVALDMLGALDHIDRLGILEFIYAMQIPCNEKNSKGESVGSLFLGQNFREVIACCDDVDINSLICPEISPIRSNSCCSQGNLAATYTALVTLLTFEDDLSRINVKVLLKDVGALQQLDGCFRATYEGSEFDTRFLYCACAICAILDDWTFIDIDKAVEYILSCISYEGGISLHPGSEAHGGSTYCGIAALCLMNRMNMLGNERIKKMTQWCLQRQIGGYQGRTNKAADSCYSFWIGSSLVLLQSFQDTDFDSTSNYLFKSCQNLYGGFSKNDSQYPDILHSFYSICWLSMSNCIQLNHIDVRLGICVSKLPKHLQATAIVANL